MAKPKGKTKGKAPAITYTKKQVDEITQNYKYRLDDCNENFKNERRRNNELARELNLMHKKIENYGVTMNRLHFISHTVGVISKEAFMTLVVDNQIAIK